ncbi:PREDICTED: CMRF35-like molecule 7 isoform X1 [Bison bison bison]|uniref:CMRF35-like molecule 7 isoform X1 n=1 Tax=Bison bison bison TaxID=43346 RepID=A0A6P3IJ77_BISBB|nr:PREDICTED: CMRF35-like molecule 7 isoform X1 [Bison bison bison]
MRLPPALLLLSLPGCLSIRGPESVWGRERESLSVQCHYDSGWETSKKWWCRGAWWASCRILVETQGLEREEKGARVSIKDDQRNRSFTVTMQDLRLDDADTYWCGIENPGANLGTQIKVTVGPREAALAVVGSQVSRKTNTSHLASSSRPYRRTHYVLLVFLKVPFLLGLVGAVLWLEEHQRDPAEQQGQPIYANLSCGLLTKDTPV